MEHLLFWSNCSIFHNIFENAVFQRCQKALFWRKYLMNSYTTNTAYGKCFKILNAFLILIPNKMLVFKAGINKMLFRLASSANPVQKVLQKESDLGLQCCLGFLGRQLLFEILENYIITYIILLVYFSYPGNSPGASVCNDCIPCCICIMACSARGFVNTFCISGFCSCKQKK